MGKRNQGEYRKDSVTALGHPSISPDGKYLYFVSDAVGGYGGKDLFRARVVGETSDRWKIWGLILIRLVMRCFLMCGIP